MILLLILGLLCYISDSANNPKCARGSKRTGDFFFKWDISLLSTQACAKADTSCANVALNRKVEYTDAQNVLQKKTYWSELRLPCISDTWLCTPFAGGVNSCNAFTLKWDNWIPRSCNKDNDYDAYIKKTNQTTYYRCCDNPDHCNGKAGTLNYNWEQQCTVKQTQQTYINALNQCWEDKKKDFMQKLVCDDERGDILDFSEKCTKETNDGLQFKTNADRTNSNCRYRVTCSKKLRSILKDFGKCACEKAKENGRTGEIIAEIMKIRWERWCPGIELSCDSGKLKLKRKYWRARYKFKVAAAKKLLDKNYIKKIRDKIAEKLNIESYDITITIGDETVTASNGRRLLTTSTEVTVDTEAQSSATATYWKGLFNTNDMTTAGGYTASNGAATSSTENEDVNPDVTTTESPNKAKAIENFNINIFVVSIIAIISFITLL